MQKLFVSGLLACGVAVTAIIGTAPPVAASDVFDSSQRFRACAAGMIGGFTNGLDERACKNYFSLPSNYHFNCARNVIRGFNSKLDRAACVSFFENQAAAAKAAYVIRDTD